MLPDAKRKCHHTGFTKSCRKLVVDGHCQGRWVQVQGVHPQTGEALSRWECVDNLTPMLLLESTQQQRQTCASIDRLRHETAQRGDSQREAMIQAVAALPAALERPAVLALSSAPRALEKPDDGHDGRDAA